MPSYAYVSGKITPAPKLTFHLDQLIDATLTKDGSYLLRNFDGKRIISVDKSIPAFLENKFSPFLETKFLRLDTFPVWLNTSRVLVAVRTEALFLSEIRSRFCDVTYPLRKAPYTPRLVELAELTEINPTTSVRLSAASQITAGGILTLCNKTYPITPSRRREEIVNKVKAMGWLKLKNGTFVNPMDFAVMYDGDDGWIDMEFGRTLRWNHFCPEYLPQIKTATPWFKITIGFVNPSKILYMDPENLVVPCDDHSLGIKKEHFDRLKKLIDPRLIHPIRYE